MSKCPLCNSVRVVKVPGGDVSICLACESLLNTIDGESKQTVFDRITSSHEALAETLVYFDNSACDDNGIGYSWCSVIRPGEHYETEAKAIAATMKRLKEVDKNEQ